MAFLADIHANRTNSGDENDAPAPSGGFTDARSLPGPDGSAATTTTGHHYSAPERCMRDTIEHLLYGGFPGAERLQMSEAIEYRAAPASLSSLATTTTEFAVVDVGSVEACAHLVAEYAPPSRVALLSFAHGHNAGGGFEHAGGSQEEDIWRKTSIFLSLWPRRRADDGPGVLARGQWIGDFDDEPRQTPFYPHAETGGSYSPHVKIVRDVLAADHSSAALPPPLLPVEACVAARPIGVITVAAQK